MASRRRRAGRFGKGRAYADDKKNVLRKLETLRRNKGIRLDDTEYTIMKRLPPHSLMEVCKRWINLIEHDEATLPLGIAPRPKGLRQAEKAAIGLGKEHVAWFELKAKICKTPTKQMSRIVNRHSENAGPSNNCPSVKKHLTRKTAGRPRTLRGTPQTHTHTHDDASAPLEQDKWMANLPRMTDDEPRGSKLDSFLEDPIQVIPLYSQAYHYRLPTPRVLFKRKEGAPPSADCPESSIVSTVPPQSSEPRLDDSEAVSPIINPLYPVYDEGCIQRRPDSELPGVEAIICDPFY